ncbi:unnamed protein product [Trichogramma brassicae]|uniref:Uncharacterized protein n=1 Tax=Trichogramma brassicae TaxID=86971 RepID=A0A6H5J9L1_9HYME|nr:unnamed protein product [Trichogramma brassicae]
MSGCHEVVEKFLELGQDPNCLVTKTSDSPLHLALAGGHDKVVEMLLRHGADPNSADENGMRPLHLIYNREFDDDLAEVFFKICDEKHQLVQVDAVDKLGRAPPLYALFHNRKKVIELLLERGANPNLAAKSGWTPMQIICDRENDDNLAKIFFDINDGKHQLVEVNVQDKFGRTPLLLAIHYNLKMTAELLLRRGADPNLSDRDGWTPLQMIFRKENDADVLAKMLFKISDEKHQLVQVNA